MLNRLRSALTGRPSKDDVGNDLDPNPAVSSHSSQSVKVGHIPDRHDYIRPEFLYFPNDYNFVPDDTQTRQVFVPNDIHRVPGRSGYAECINGGKTEYNEDQSAVSCFHIHCPAPSTSKQIEDGTINGIDSTEYEDVEVTYFGIFDGHAGTGAALMAADLLITHLQEKLSEIREDLHVILQGKKNSSHQSEVTLNSLVTGALEASFCALDEQIEQEKNTYCISGGSTAIVALFLLDRVFIANAGDCRAVLYLGDKIISLSKEHSPINELGRLQTTAYFHPELLCGEFSCCMFVRRLMKNDMGKQVLCKEPLKKGWVYREVTTDDIKFPLVQSNGIKTRLMGTIGVARGFGDHDLTTFENVPIKPFLIPNPDVEVYQLEDVTLSEDDVLIMACDGLWDVMSNETAIEIVRKVLEHTSKDDHKRYTMAATELVQFARGKLTNQGWKMPNGEEGSFDDICVFVIPVHNIVTKLSTKL